MQGHHSLDNGQLRMHRHLRHVDSLNGHLVGVAVGLGAQVVRTAHNRVAAHANRLNEAIPGEGEVLKNAINT